MFLIAAGVCVLVTNHCASEINTVREAIDKSNRWVRIYNYIYIYVLQIKHH